MRSFRDLIALVETAEDHLDSAGTNTGTLKNLNPVHADRHDALKHLHSARHEPDAVTDAVRRYSEVSGRMSRHLIAKSKKEPVERDIDISRDIKALDTYLSRSKPLPEDIVVYSSLGFMPEGDRFRTPAFLSTSIDPKRAAAHANDRRKGDHDVILRIELPAGYTGGRYLGSSAKYEGEMEYLIRRGEQFVITRRSEHQLAGEKGPFTHHVFYAIPA